MSPHEPTQQAGLDPGILHCQPINVSEPGIVTSTKPNQPNQNESNIKARTTETRLSAAGPKLKEPSSMNSPSAGNGV